jgi:hypothetical protein
LSSILRQVAKPILDGDPISKAMNLELSDEEAAALTKEHADVIGNDRYPFSERICSLKAALAKLRLEPIREPLPPKFLRRHEHPQLEGDAIRHGGRE